MTLLLLLLRVAELVLHQRLVGYDVYSENGAMPGSLLAELVLEAARRVLPQALEIVKYDIPSTLSRQLHLALAEGPVDHLRLANGIFLASAGWGAGFCS